MVSAHEPRDITISNGASDPSQASERILDPNTSRLSVFPIEHMDIWHMYKKHQSVTWTAEEINLADDKCDWDNKLNDSQRKFISNILAFFAGSDGIVNDNLGTRFMNDVQYIEAKCFYAFQIMIENVHNETYSLLIDTYIKDDQEKERLLNGIETIPCVKKKADWAQKWIESSDSFATRLIAFAIVEGIFFSGAFCSIYWLKDLGLMHGLSFSNDLISRDESLHTDFAVLLYNNHITHKLDTSTIHAIFDEAVEIEKEFITESIPCDMIGMNMDLMKQYIEFIADRLLIQLGVPERYNASCPFSFMEKISCETKQNFFEQRVSEYQKATSERVFDAAEDF